LAPEFLFGGRQISFKSDIYSLGIIIIGILTGENGYPCPDIDYVRQVSSIISLDCDSLHVMNPQPLDLLD
jgi:serine/threonine protein kinase